MADVCVIAPVVVLTAVVPWFGAAATITDAGFGGAPLGLTVPFPSTWVLTGPFRNVDTRPGWP